MITWMLSSCAGLFSSGCQVAASNSRVSLRYLACTRKERWHLLRRGLMHVFGIGGKNCCNSWHISRDRYGVFLLQTICKSNYKWMVGFSEADIWFKTLLWWRWDEVFLDSGDSWILFWCNRPHGDPLVSKYRIYGFAFTRCCHPPPPPLLFFPGSLKHSLWLHYHKWFYSISICNYGLCFRGLRPWVWLNPRCRSRLV